MDFLNPQIKSARLFDLKFEKVIHKLPIEPGSETGASFGRKLLNLIFVDADLWLTFNHARL